MTDSAKKTLEVRAFGHLSGLFEKRGLSVPLLLDIDQPMTGTALAQKLEIPREEIEVIIVNGYTQSLSYSIQPGDRVAFVPWGTPGPYRIFLGFIYKNKR
jgi:hypothetical protein